MSSAELRNLALEAKRLLAFQQELGLAGLDLRPEIFRLQTPQAVPQRQQLAPAPRDSASSAEIRRRASEEVKKMFGQAPVRSNKTAPADSTPVAERAVQDSRVELQNYDQSGQTKRVFGAGISGARLMFIFEGPGRDEHLQGEVFVGRTGELLDRMISAMGIERRDVYITHLVKERARQNRDDDPASGASWISLLQQQIRDIQPNVIVAMGPYATHMLTGQTAPMERIRGAWLEYDGIALMPTFHPAHLLRHPAEKKPTWQDLQAVMKRLGLQHPTRR